VTVAPSTLVFDTPDAIQTKQLEIVNDSDERVAIKVGIHSAAFHCMGGLPIHIQIQTSSPSSFRVNPVCVMMEPRATQQIQIERQVSLARPDLLLLHCAKVSAMSSDDCLFHSLIQSGMQASEDIGTEEQQILALLDAVRKRSTTEVPINCTRPPIDGQSNFQGILRSALPQPLQLNCLI
jgi:hypothetical protein